MFRRNIAVAAADVDIYIYSLRCACCLMRRHLRTLAVFATGRRRDEPAIYTPRRHAGDGRLH